MIWNDYLLPTLVLDSEKPTIPMAVQYLRGGYGSIDMGAMMAMLVLAILPIIVFYLTCQKYIIKRRSCRSSQRLTNAQKSFLLQAVQQKGLFICREITRISYIEKYKCCRTRGYKL